MKAVHKQLGIVKHLFCMQTNMGVDVTMMCYSFGKANRPCLGDCHLKRAHGGIVVLAPANSGLLFEIIKGVKGLDNYVAKHYLGVFYSI